jgi:DNA-binding transcriptional regulator YdaS (Cro superfamily)
MITSVDEVIKVLGGPGAVASLVGVGASAVSNWSFRREIPAEYFVMLRDALGAMNEEVSPSVFRFKEPAEARA